MVRFIYWPQTKEQRKFSAEPGFELGADGFVGQQVIGKIWLFGEVPWVQ